MRFERFAGGMSLWIKKDAAFAGKAASDENGETQ